MLLPKFQQKKKHFAVEFWIYDLDVYDAHGLFFMEKLRYTHA